MLVACVFIVGDVKLNRFRIQFGVYKCSSFCNFVGRCFYMTIYMNLGLINLSLGLLQILNLPFVFAICLIK